MPRIYNHIHNKLVREEGDVVGHIAYSLYKGDKRAFIEQYRKENNGQEPNEQDLNLFHLTCNQPSILHGYRNTANNILQEFVQRLIGEDREQMERDVLNDHLSHLRSVVPGKRKTILYSIYGALFFSAILALIGFIFVFRIDETKLYELIVPKAEQAKVENVELIPSIQVDLFDAQP